MSIAVNCVSCGRAYAVGEQMAGRRVKCRACNAVFEIPAAEAPPEETPDFSTLTELKRQAVAAPGPAQATRSAPPIIVPPVVVSPVTVPPVTLRPVTVPPVLTNYSHSDSPSAPASSALPYVGVPRKRPVTVRPLGPHDDMLHEKFPIALVLFGYLLPLLNSFYQATQTPNPGIAVAILGAMALLLVILVIPTTVAGLKIAVRIRKFELVDSPGFRLFAAFSAAPLVLWAVLLASGVGLDCLVSRPPPGTSLASILLTVMMGLMLGVIVTFFLLWLFLRQDFISALLAWITSGLAYLLGCGLSATLVVSAMIGIDRLSANSSHWFSWASAPAARTPAAPAATTEQARLLSANHLFQIQQALLTYANSHRGLFPPDLSALDGPSVLTKDVLSSPIAHASAGPDYVYRAFDGLRSAVIQGYIVAYDAGALEQGDGTNVLLTSGEVKWLSKPQFDATLTAGDQVEADWIAGMARLKAEQEAREQASARQKQPIGVPVPPPQPEPAPADTALQAPPAPLPPGEAAATDPPPNPPEKPWHAEPDAPAARLPIRPTLRLIFPAKAADLLYPPQPSSYVCAGSEFEPGVALPREVHDAWNLKTSTRTGRLVGPLGLKDPIMSPDGQYLAGRVTGGQGEVSTFEIWSFKSGAKVQTLVGAPTRQEALPVAVGFLGADQILTLGDDLQAWDIKGGTQLQRVEGLARSSDDVVAVSAGGKLVAIIDRDQKLTLMDAAHGKLLGSTSPPPAPGGDLPDLKGQRALAFSPSGAELALFLAGRSRRMLVWTVADGTLAADFQFPSSSGALSSNRKASLMSWLPDNDGWLIEGDQIVDRATGFVLYQVPAHREPLAEEYGPRRVLDASHLLMSFKSFTQGIGMAAVPLPADAIAKARAAVRGGKG